MDVITNLPTSVIVTFPKVVDGVPSGDRYAVTITPADTSLTFPNIPFGPHNKIFHDSFPANYSGMTLQNGTTLTNLATAIAEDYYQWQIAYHESVFADCIPYEPSGMDYQIIWRFVFEDIQTEIYRPPWNNLCDTLNHGDTAGDKVRSVDECCDWLLTTIEDNSVITVFPQTPSIVPIPTITGSGPPSADGIIVGQYYFNLTDMKLYVWDGTSWLFVASSGAAGGVHNHIADGRLSWSTSDPNPSTDATAKTSIAYTEFTGNQIALYDGSNWAVYTFSGGATTLSLVGLTASTLYNVYIYDNSGTITLEASATGTTRQDGVLVKSGDTTKRYLGRVYIDSTGGQTDDNLTQRFIANYYNVVRKALTASNSSPHSRSAASWSSWNNGSTPITLEWMASGRNDSVHVEWSARIEATNAGVPGKINFDLNSTGGPLAPCDTVNNATAEITVGDSQEVHFSSGAGFNDGYNVLELIEYGDSIDPPNFDCGHICANVWV